MCVYVFKTAYVQHISGRIFKKLSTVLASGRGKKTKGQEWEKELWDMLGIQPRRREGRSEITYSKAVV